MHSNYHAPAAVAERRGRASDASGMAAPKHPVLRSVLVTGPESSGTRLMARIIDAHPLCRALHRSMPNNNDWDLTPFLSEYPYQVVMVRSGHCTCMSAVAAGHARSYTDAIARRQRALRILDKLLPSALWVGYEKLVSSPGAQLERLAVFLDLPVDTPWQHEAITDENLKYSRPSGLGHAHYDRDPEVEARLRAERLGTRAPAK